MITSSPKLLSDIAGSGQIGDFLIHMVPFGAPGTYDIGTVVSLRNEAIVPTTAATAGDVYGIIAQERFIVDLPSERLDAAAVIRRGSFNADELITADDVSLETLAPRMRELGMYLEGLERTLAPPFRLRSINPSRAPIDTADLVIRVALEGSISAAAVVLWDEIARATTVLGYNSADATIADTGDIARVVRVQVRDGNWVSNFMNFAVVAAVAPPPPVPLSEQAPPPTPTSREQHLPPRKR